MGADGVAEAWRVIPLGDNVVVKRDHVPEYSPAGLIYIPESSREEPRTGTVLDAGPGYYDDDGRFVEAQLRPGDRVAFSRAWGHEFEINGATVLIGREAHLYAKVESESPGEYVRDVTGDKSGVGREADAELERLVREGVAAEMG